MIFIDTNVAIDIRDGLPAALEALGHLPEPPLLSIVTRIELEGGVFRNPGFSAKRRESLTRILERFAVINITEADVLAYGRIVAAGGFDRRRILDRLIAAQCLTRGATLVTANAGDFADIADLRLHSW